MDKFFFVLAMLVFSIQLFAQKVIENGAPKANVDQLIVVDSIGSNFVSTGNYDKALEYFFEGLKLAESRKDTFHIGSFTNNISVVYYQTEQYEPAKIYARMAIEIHTQQNNKTALCDSYNNLANALFQNYEDSLALEVYEKALALRLEIADKLKIAVAYRNLGALLYEMGNVEKGISLTKKSLAQRMELNDTIGVLSSSNALAEMYLILENNDSAGYFFKNCLLYNIPSMPLFQLRHFYHSYAEFLYVTKDYKMAFDYRKKLESVRDSILNNETTAKIAEMQTRYETEKKDAEINTLKTESELKELQIAQTQTLVIAISVIAILVLILFVFYNRQRRLKLLAQMALEKEQLQKERFRVVIDTEEKERIRVARELHDGLGQMLSTVRLFVSDISDTDENPKVERSLKALDSTIEEVRNISHNMMPLKLMELGLSTALEDMAKKVNDSSKLKMEVTNAELLSFGVTESIAIYRTIQEVVNNAIKYAKANVIEVQITDSEDALLITIKDDGQGFNTENIAKSKGIGWSNIYARMELIGADVKVISKAKEGTQVNLKIPNADTKVKSAS